MTCFRLARWCALALLLCWTGGCIPSGSSPLDEQKEPHFLSGKNRVYTMDWPGAIDAFEKALRVNPNSASAHFELGVLYGEKVGDNAAAIYHYDRYLKLRPSSGNADTVRSLINRCKMEIAKSVSALPSGAPDVQHELASLAQQNQELKAELTRWQTWYSASNRGQPPPITPTPANPTPTANPAPPPAVPSPAATPTPAATRTHVVKAGESPYSIARRYGISVSTLMAANPQVRATHLRVGQALNIPGQ